MARSRSSGAEEAQEDKNSRGSGILGKWLWHPTEDPAYTRRRSSQADDRAHGIIVEQRISDLGFKMKDDTPASWGKIVFSSAGSAAQMSKHQSAKYASAPLPRRARRSVADASGLALLADAEKAVDDE